MNDSEDLVAIEDECDYARPAKRRRRVYSLVSTHSTKEDAMCALETHEELVYKHRYNYGRKGNGNVYICVYHRDCDHHLRIRMKEDEWLLEETGTHSSEESGETKTGVSLLVRSAVESALIASGPAGCAKILEKKLKPKKEGEPCLLSLIPSKNQMKSLKSTMRKAMEGGWEMDSPAVVHEWGSEKMMSSRVQFFGAEPEFGSILFTQSAALKMNELFVMKIFDYETTIGGRSIQSIGIIFSSRRVLCNVYRAHQAQGLDGVLGVTDGTYKLHFGGWTLVNFGTYCTRYVDRKYSKHYVPFSFLFVRTEHESTYSELFRTTRDFSQLIFGISLNIAFGSLDHSWAIANAFRAVWPDISLVTCWPHMKRKSGEQKGRLKARTYYDTHVAIHIDWLHEAQSTEQFSALAALCVDLWRRNGEGEYADWFEEIYLQSPWNSWFASAVGPTIGILPSQNALESFHGSIKQCCIYGLRANTATVLNTSLPDMLKYCGEDPDDTFLGHFGEGAIPSEMVVKAKAIVDDKRNYLKMGTVSDPMRTRWVVCNASKYAYSVKNRHGITVTEARVKRYTKSLHGELMKNAVPTSISRDYLSLHRVQILVDHFEPFKMRTNWTRDEIREVRKGFVCGCKGNRQTGWICSHVLATMVLVGAINFDSILASMPTRLAPGGQVKVRGALNRDTNDKLFYSVKKLMAMFQESPAANLHWNLLRPDGDGEIVGKIVKWIPGRGRYAWKILFSDGTSEELECEALAEAISYSYSVGLNIMGKLV